MVELTETEIDTTRLLREASREDCGATVLFLGSTRRWTGDKETAFLEYQAYREMALAEMEKLRTAAMERWPLRHAAVVHRIGRVEIQQISVAVVVSSPHRKAAFAAGQWLIDEVKRQVPIWKQEFWADEQSAWVHESADKVTPDSLTPDCLTPDSLGREHHAADNLVRDSVAGQTDASNSFK